MNCTRKHAKRRKDEETKAAVWVIKTHFVTNTPIWRNTLYVYIYVYIYIHTHDSEEWRRMPYRYQGKIAVFGPSRGVAGEYADCGWAMVQLDADGVDTPLCVMCGTVLVHVDVLRTFRRDLKRGKWT